MSVEAKKSRDIPMPESALLDHNETGSGDRLTQLASAISRWNRIVDETGGIRQALTFIENLFRNNTSPLKLIDGDTHSEVSTQVFSPIEVFYQRDLTAHLARIDLFTDSPSKIIELRDSLLSMLERDHPSPTHTYDFPAKNKLRDWVTQIDKKLADYQPYKTKTNENAKK